MEIEYVKANNTIIIKQNSNTVSVTPEALLDALDECLLMKVKKINMQQITNLDWYITSMKQLADESKKAETGLDLRRIKEAKNCLAQIRYAIKLGDMMEAKVRSEILERRVGESKK